MKTHSRSKFRRRMQQAGAVVSVAGLSGGAVSAQNKPATPAQTANVPVVGRVVTPDGKPVKEATVFWIERDVEGQTARRFTTDTDAQGQFRFAEPPPKPGEQRYVMLLAQASGWGLSFQKVPLGADASKPVTITLLPSTTLRVGFTDPTGKPLPNLPVRVSGLLYGETFNYLSIPASMHGRWEQKTDSKGECVFPGLPQGAKVHLEMQTERFASLSYENDVTLDKTSGPQTARIRLVPGGTIEGRVIDVDGKPVGGIRVGAQAVGIGAGGGGRLRTHRATIVSPVYCLARIMSVCI